LLQITNFLTESPVNLLYLANISQWHKRRVAITSSVSQSVIEKAVHRWHTRLRACVRLKAIILNICYRPLLITVVISQDLFRATRIFQRNTT